MSRIAFVFAALVATSAAHAAPVPCVTASNGGTGLSGQA